MPTNYSQILSLNGQLSSDRLYTKIGKPIIISLIQYFEANFLWKVSLKILNSGLILKTFTPEDANEDYTDVEVCVSNTGQANKGHNLVRNYGTRTKVDVYS